MVNDTHSPFEPGYIPMLAPSFTDSETSKLTDCFLPRRELMNIFDVQSDKIKHLMDDMLNDLRLDIGYLQDSKIRL